MRLSELIGERPVAALLGMCKNAGKTTALNRLIREYAALGRPIALTSIGRDGEQRDLVSGTEKPPIYMYRGMLAATAEKLLDLSDVSREILALCDVHTPLGRVVIFRARSEGFVQLAGPSIVEQMQQLRQQLCDMGAETVLIDGALSRRSPAAGALDGACILSTGASLDRNMDQVVEKTAFVCRVLTLPERAAPGTALGRFTLFQGGEAVETAEDAPALGRALKANRAEQVLFSGAFTESMAQSLLRAGADLEGLAFTGEDSSRFLLRQESFQKLEKMGLQFSVLRGSYLAAVTVNPVSAGGWRFDPAAFLKKMGKAAPVPVLDVGRYDAAAEL